MNSRFLRKPTFETSNLHPLQYQPWGLTRGRGNECWLSTESLSSRESKPPHHPKKRCFRGKQESGDSRSPTVGRTASEVEAAAKPCSWNYYLVTETHARPGNVVWAACNPNVKFQPR